MVGVLLALLYSVKDTLRYEHSLFLLGRETIHSYLIAVTEIRPQVLVLVLSVVCNDRVCRFEYGRSRTVVLFKLYDLSAELLFKREDILDGSASEAVDTLILITNDAQVSATLGKQ